MADQSHHGGGSRGYQAVAVSVVATMITMFIVFARVWTRRFNMGPEDWTIIVSYAFSMTLTVLIGIEVLNGQGRHIDTISPHDYKNLYKAFWASVPVYQAALTVTKVSILLQYWRVFVGKNVRRSVIILGVVTVVYGIWSVLSTTFSCSPVAYFWNKSIPGGKCLNLNAVWFANASLNILTDIASFVLPIPVLKQLQLPNRQKWGLMGVFALGAFVCLTSILRLHALYTLSHSNDVTWDNGPAAYWSSLEVNIGIICASLPTLRKAISRLLPNAWGLSSAGGPTSRNTPGANGTGATSGFRKFQAGGGGTQSQMQTHISTAGGRGIPTFVDEDDAISPVTAWDIKGGVELKIMREEEEEDEERDLPPRDGNIRVTHEVVWQESQQSPRMSVEDMERGSSEVSSDEGGILGNQKRKKSKGSL